jgi:homoserine O-succinyltransferase
MILNSLNNDKSNCKTIKILLLNLMPNKEETDNQFYEVLKNSSFNIDITLLKTLTYEPTHADPAYLNKHYTTFNQIQNDYYDCLIITGSPIEKLEYLEIKYLDEIAQIIAKVKETSAKILYICASVFLGLYINYGIKKVMYDNKKVGIFKQSIINDSLFNGIDELLLPVSSYAYIKSSDIIDNKDLVVLSKDLTNITIFRTTDYKETYILGHLEYSSDTIKKEIERDKKLQIFNYQVQNYLYEDIPLHSWTNSLKVFTNWIYYYVEGLC